MTVMYIACVQTSPIQAKEIGDVFTQAIMYKALNNTYLDSSRSINISVKVNGNLILNLNF